MKSQNKVLPSEDIFLSLNIKGKNPSSFIGSTSYSNNNRYFPTYSPIDGSVLAEVGESTLAELDQVVSASKTSFLSWRTVPAPRRGALVRLFAEKLRANKSTLASLITLEVGKILSEAEGEVQEMIDICDFAVGLSRQLYGLTIASERPSHRLMEQWHPLGPVGVISAFNFPVAVWSWNTALALVCGNSVIWKPSEKAPLCALASHLLLCEVIDSFSDAPPGLSCLVQGGKEIGEGISASPDIPLVCATGSVATGKAVGKKVADRLGKSLLELGGNNAMIVTKSADLDLALRAITFSAAGTAGQRCTTLRRLIVHRDIKEPLLEDLKEVFSSIKVGSPLDEGVLLGPLIDVQARESYENALKRAVKEGGTLVHGEVVRDGVPEGGAYVRPALVSISADAAILKEETFAPILYVVGYDSFDDAIRIHNNVPQGLSSAIFTNDIREAELFLSPAGSDCGIANVNIGTSGAEIGGAFGGEKETGGGRQSGSDAWKNYMRRATNTMNYSRELPLAQGVSFEVKRNKN
jgi:aldehyde dehydrogenase (NAD+)